MRRSSGGCRARASRARTERDWLRPDLVAGVVLAAILVPQGMAYAELAGVPAVYGLYATIGCLVGYALFGPSRVLVLGPDSSVSPLIFAAIVPLAVPGDVQTRVALAGMLALLVGLIEIAMGLGRLGFVADLLSSEVQVGYMNGLAITIIVGQLPKLCGFSTDATSFGGEVVAWFEHLDETKAAALVVGVGVLVVLLVLPRVTSKIPAVLVAVVGATVVSAVLGLSDHIATVGTLPSGFPKPTVPWTSIHDVWPLLIAAVGITLVSLTDTIATSAAFAARRGDDVDPNQEMIGLGAANLTAGFLQGFAVSTSGSRTAVAEQSGAKSQLTGLVGAGLVVTLLVLFQSLLADLPQSALAAVVIAAALSLLNLGALRRYASVRRSALVLSLTASVGVIALGVLQGIVARDRPVGADVLPTQLVAARRRARSRRRHRRVAQHRGVPRRDRGRRASSCTAGRRRSSSPTPARSATRSTGWSTSAIRRGSCSCARRSPMSTSRPRACSSSSTTSSTPTGVHMAFVEMRTRLQDLVERYGLFQTLDSDHFYPSVEAALAAIEEDEQ